MSNYRKDMMELDDLAISKAKGVLSRLFRIILYQNNVRSTQWEMLMDRLLSDPRNPIPKNAKDRSSQKGNLNKALRGDKMTWKTFERGLRFLGIRSIRFIIEPTWANGRTTRHYVDQELGGFTHEDYDMTDTEGAEFVERVKQRSIAPMVLNSQVADDPSIQKSLDRVSRTLDRIGRIPRRRPTDTP